MRAIQSKPGAGVTPLEMARETGVSRGSVQKAKAQMPTTGKGGVETQAHEKASA